MTITQSPGEPYDKSLARSGNNVPGIENLNAIRSYFYRKVYFR
jgi:hypothetical protein